VLLGRAAADQKDKIANARPNSTRSAGAGGSSSTMLRLYTDESPGLKVDPVVVLVLSLVFIMSVVALHSRFFSFFLPLPLPPELVRLGWGSGVPVCVWMVVLTCRLR
jgi:preprotein translocase subunit Sec61beta